jgi:hypothetical protein
MKKVFILGVLALAVASPASAFFNDSFLGYDLGVWNGQGGWSGSVCMVISETAGDKYGNSMSCSGGSYIERSTAQPDSSGFSTFDLKIPSCSVVATGTAQTNQVIFFDAGGNFSGWQFQCNAGLADFNILYSEYGTSTILLATSSVNVWDNLSFGWDCETDNVILGVNQVFSTSSLGWDCSAGINKIQIGIQTGGAYYDNFFNVAINPLPELELDDCSSYSGYEKLFCNFQNTFKSLFFPTSTKLEELKTNIDVLNTRFPMNYLATTIDFFTDVHDNLNENGDIELGLFNSGTSSLSFSAMASTTKTYGGNTISILDFIKLFLTFALLLIIIKWFISYVKRIFK